MIKRVLIGLIIISSLNGYSQEFPLTLVDTGNQFFRTFQLQTKKGVLYANLFPEFNYTGISVLIPSENKFEGSYIYPGSEVKQELQLFHEYIQEDADRDITWKRSNVIIPESTQEHFSFYSGSIEGIVRFHLLMAGNPKKAVEKKKYNRTKNRKLFRKKSGGKDSPIRIMPENQPTQRT